MKEMVDGYEVTKCSAEPCQICVEGKMTALPFKNSESKSKETLELIHTDLCEIAQPSLGKNEYTYNYIGR